MLVTADVRHLKDSASTGESAREEPAATPGGLGNPASRCECHALSYSAAGVRRATHTSGDLPYRKRPGLLRCAPASERSVWPRNRSSPCSREGPPTALAPPTRKTRDAARYANSGW